MKFRLEGDHVVQEEPIRFGRAPWRLHMHDDGFEVTISRYEADEQSGAWRLVEQLVLVKDAPLVSL